jgi:F-type H+-transporting ATPase subunit a
LDEYKLVVSLKPEPIICLGGTKTGPASCSPETFFIVSNSTIATITFFIIITLVFILGSRKASLIPGRFQGGIEMLLEMIYNLVESSSNRRVARVIFPLICSYFIWILFSNWLSLLPGVGSIGQVYNIVEEGKTVKELVPLFRAPNADLNMTFSIALLTVILVQVAAIISHGVGGWLKEFVPTRSVLDILLTPIEIIGQFSRILSLAFRLFGNVFAGEVLLAVILKIAAPAFIIFLGLEVFVGLIQALVFALLSLVYLSLVTEGGHGEEHHGEEHHGETAHAASH